jgi:hypothetical protein
MFIAILLIFEMEQTVTGKITHELTRPATSNLKTIIAKLRNGNPREGGKTSNGQNFRPQTFTGIAVPLIIDC